MLLCGLGRLLEQARCKTSDHVSRRRGTYMTVIKIVRFVVVFGAHERVRKAKRVQRWERGARVGAWANEVRHRYNSVQGRAMYGRLNVQKTRRARRYA